MTEQERRENQAKVTRMMDIGPDTLKQLHQMKRYCDDMEDMRNMAQDHVKMLQDSQERLLRRVMELEDRLQVYEGPAQA